MKRKTAFTLAEVLITLTIIGVIAALTIPNLIQSYKKHQVEVGIREAFAIINNMVTMEIAKDGGTGITTPGSELGTTTFRDTILPYFKTSKVCYLTASNIKQPSNCTSDLKDYYVKSFDNTTNATNNGYWAPNRMQLNNGMIVSVVVGGAGAEVTFFVDINGFKNPNQLGYDVHAFYLNISNIDQYRKNYRGKLVGGYNLNGHASLKCVDIGNYCTYVIHENGWRIPDDYPVKKW